MDAVTLPDTDRLALGAERVLFHEHGFSSEEYKTMDAAETVRTRIYRCQGEIVTVQQELKYAKENLAAWGKNALPIHKQKVTELEQRLLTLRETCDNLTAESTELDAAARSVVEIERARARGAQ